MADIDYGTALAVLDDLPARWTFTTGATTVIYAVVRRWTTPRGSLPWAPGSCVDLRGLCGGKIDTRSRAEWQQALSVEAERDERVQSCQVSVAGSGDEVTITAALVLADGVSAPFKLVVPSVGDVTVSLLRNA